MIDRKNNILKLAQGEFVAPENLAVIFAKSTLISQIYIHGDPVKSYLVAVVVPSNAFYGV